jgi:hypothetical protein
MAKSKNFQDWMESESYYQEGEQKPKRDGKRYDKKKARIQNERRNKSRQREDFFKGN